MNEINIKKILRIKPTKEDRISFFYREYQKETAKTKKLRLLKKIQILGEKK